MILDPGFVLYEELGGIPRGVIENYPPRPKEKFE